MLYEFLLLGTTIASASVLLTGCSSKKKETPPPVPVAPVAPAPVNDADTTSTTGTSTTGGVTTRAGTVRAPTTKAPTATKPVTTRAAVSEEKKEKPAETEKKKEPEVKEEEKKVEDTKKKKETLISPDPSEIRFATASTSQRKLRLKNLTTKKVMFKIKSSTNEVYMVNPVFGTIEPSNFTDVVVTHKPTTKREDKLVIVSTEMLGKEIEMAKTFKQIRNTGADVTVKLFSD